MEKPPAHLPQPVANSKSQAKKRARIQRAIDTRARKADEKKKRVKEPPPPPPPTVHEPGYPLPKTAEDQVRLKKERSERKWQHRTEIANKMNSSKYAIAVDLAFNSSMMSKEHLSLARQINTMFGWMRKAALPFQLNLVGFDHSSNVAIELKKFLPTPQTWLGLRTYEAQLLDVFPREKIIYLSPDAPDVLEKVEPEKIYVLGGLVDVTRIKNASMQRSQSLGVKAAHLPVRELMESTERDVVMNLNHVAALLSHQAELNDWRAAWAKVLAWEGIADFKLKPPPAAAAVNGDDEKQEETERKEQETKQEKTKKRDEEGDDGVVK